MTYNKFTKSDLEKIIMQTENEITDLENKINNINSNSEKKILIDNLHIKKVLLENFKELLEEGDYDDDLPVVNKFYSPPIVNKVYSGGKNKSVVHKITDKKYKFNGKLYTLYLGVKGGEYIRKNNKFVLVSSL